MKSFLRFKQDINNRYTDITDILVIFKLIIRFYLKE